MRHGYRGASEPKMPPLSILGQNPDSSRAHVDVLSAPTFYDAKRDLRWRSYQCEIFDL